MGILARATDDDQLHGAGTAPIGPAARLLRLKPKPARFSTRQTVRRSRITNPKVSRYPVSRLRNTSYRLFSDGASSAAGPFLSLQSHSCTIYRIPVRLSSAQCFLPSQTRRILGVSARIFMAVHTPGTLGDRASHSINVAAFRRDTEVGRKNQRQPPSAIGITKNDCRLSQPEGWYIGGLIPVSYMPHSTSR